MSSFLRKVDDVLRTKESKFQDFQESEKKWGNEDLDPSRESNHQVSIERAIC